ncbi:hypothetical protein ABK040_006872 [Willaertia magna]
MLNSINNLYLVNKQFNNCAKEIFDNTIYKYLFSIYLQKINSNLQQKIIEFNNYKTLYSRLNRYFHEHITSVNYDKSTPMKMTVVGDGGVGKSSITLKFVQNIFLDELDPTIEDSYKKTVIIDGKNYLLQILDTAGQEEFRSLRDYWYIDTDYLIAVCDLTRKDTLLEVKCNIESLFRVRDRVDFPIVIIGNKLDLIEQEKETYSRQITKEMVDELIEEVCKYSSLKPIYLETSAKTGYNIEEVFSEVVRLKLYGNINWNSVVEQLLNGELKECNKPKNKCIIM